MGHTPYGYRIENGIAVIDNDAADRLRNLYKNYLAGMGLISAAAEVGIDAYHGSVKRLLSNKHYLGDAFYPAIIDERTFVKAQEEITRRAEALGRNGRKTKPRELKPFRRFRLGELTEHFDSPVQQAEYIYSQIESEVS